MICPNCKKEITENSIFCTNCGCMLTEAFQNNAENNTVNNSNEAAVSPENNAAATNEAYYQAAYNANSTAQPPQNNNPQPVSGFVPNANMGNTQNYQTMQNPSPAPQQEFVAPSQPKQKKSAKKALPFIIGGGAAAVAIAVFCCIKFAAADIAHSFMGDEKYAASLAQGTISFVSNYNGANSSMTSALSSALGTNANGSYYDQYADFIEKNPDSELSYSDFRDIKSNSSTLSAIGQMLPENGIYAKIESKTELTGKFYELIAEATGADKDEVKEAFEACNSFSTEGKLSVKEDGVDLSYLISSGGKDLDSGNVYYNTEDGILFYSNSAIYSSPISTKLIPLDIDLSSSSDKSDRANLEKEKNALVQKISDIYSKHIKNAETEYSDVTESVGEGEFKGKSMKATFVNEALAELLQDIVDAFLDSDYFESLLEEAYGGDIPDSFDIDDLKDSAEKAFDELAKSSVKTSLTIEHFINGDNSVAGLRLSVTVKNGGDKSTTQVMYISAKSDFYAEVKANNTTYLKCQGKKSSSKSGTAEITINIPGSYSSETQKLKLNVEYSDLGKTELFGETQILGKFKINISGNILDQLSLRSDPVDIPSLIKKTTITLSASSKGNGIEYGIQLDNESYGKMSYTIEIGENAEAAFDRTNMTEDSSVNMNSGSTETIDVQIAALEHIRDICSENELMSFAMNQSSGGDFSEQVQSQIDQLEKNKKYIAVYKDYDSYYTVNTANSIASNIQSYLYSYNYNDLSLKSKQPVTVKVYYDGSGSMSIIDMAGEDEALLKNIKDLGYKNAYVEILYYKAYMSYAPVGVTVVMTDSKEHHCDSLPDAYNYIDGVYPWSGDSNYIGDYVVGAYPYLYQGNSTYEQTLKDLADQAAKYNEYAEKGFTAFNAFLSNTKNSFNLSTSYSSNSYAAFKIQLGTWSNYINIDQYSFKNTLNTASLFSYMKTNVPEIKDGYLFIYVSNNTVVGASYSESSYYISTPMFIAGVTDSWGLADGVDIYGNVMGTYPVIKSFDGTLSDNVKKLMVGTWQNNYNKTKTLTITEEDLKHITEISEYSVEYLRVKFEYEDGTSNYYYFNMAGKMEYGWDTYTKK